MTAAATANRHAVLLEVATTYLGLLRAREEAVIVEGAFARAADLANLTANYAEAGQGLLADAEMAAVQPLLWEQRRIVAAERQVTASAELVRLLHLEGGVAVEPIETGIPVLQLFSGDEDVEQLHPGDLDEPIIAIWDPEVAERYRDAFRDIQAHFVDEPEAALGEAQDLVAEAVQALADALLAEQVSLDPHEQDANPDTEAMRIAMRGYRDFLERVLAL